MKTVQELAELLKDAEESVKRVVYKHYKGEIYEVLGVVFNTETEEVDIRYKRIGGPGYNYAYGEFYIEYVRPYKQWFEDVEPEPGTFVPRFQKVRKIERWHTDSEIEELKRL